MLITSLSALFSFTTLINAVEASVILLITACLIYLLTAEQAVEADESLPAKNRFDANNIYLYIQSAWLGRLPLLAAFLPFFIIVNSVLFYADYRAENGSYTIASWLTILVILALPVFWWTVAVWRCSIHSRRLFASAARFLTVVVYYEFILRLIIAYYYPQILFNCQQLIIELGDCL